jgi:hypothetical protein
MDPLTEKYVSIGLGATFFVGINLVMYKDIDNRIKELKKEYDNDLVRVKKELKGDNQDPFSIVRFVAPAYFLARLKNGVGLY